MNGASSVGESGRKESRMLTAFVTNIYFLSVLLGSVSWLDNVKSLRTFSRWTFVTWAWRRTTFRKMLAWLWFTTISCDTVTNKIWPTFMCDMLITVQSQRCVEIVVIFLRTTNYLSIHSYQDIKPKRRTPSLCFVLYHFLLSGRGLEHVEETIDGR